MYKSRNRRSRYFRKEEARSLRQAVLFGFLTIVIALVLLFLGIPLLIKMALFIGDLRSSSQPVETGDTVSPSPVQLQPLPEATNSAQLSIQGFSEPGSVVEILINNESSQKIVAENDGKFTAEKLLLSPGKNVLTAYATDESGNKSLKPEDVIIYFDNIPPELEINEPAEGSKYSGSEKKITIKGKTEKDATVTINDRLVIVGPEGHFEYPLILSEGENSIKIRAVDPAGNQSEKEIKVTYSP